MRIDTLIKARWVIPVEPEGLVLEDHALAIHNGRIVDILPTRDAESRYQPDRLEALPHHALIPGLVNAHTHAAMALLRGVADDLPLQVWLEHHIWPLEARWVSEVFVRDGTQLAMAEMLRGGVTCFNDMYFYPEITAREAALAGMRAVVGMIVVDFPTAWGSGPDEYLHKGLALHDSLRHEPLIETAFAPHAPYTVSDDPLVRVRTLAAELERPIHMHLHETAGEIELGKASHGMRPFKRLQQLELLGPGFIAVHMTQLEDEEIAAFAQFGGSVVHCPESNLKLASGFCPIAKLLAAGVNVALGTDGAASNNDMDLLGEMRTAALLAKGVAGDASAVPAAQALRMATLNGAKALGLDHEIGSLTVGKSADIVAIDMDHIETQPLFNPLSDLVYAASRHQISDVWVAGRQVLKKRDLITLDRAAITEKAIAWRERLSAPTTA
ncbi:TRZ/ATZ family hydrolase [Methylococcus sp. EFPC2]|uniref:TRZ/ATZ family hydrolase n=1 Tax=Methylococcus sp. EFPC2 TaxID=2812648 RepID=UPI0019678947|nr:TRZ/ATZ family hydrolase [Methylococcus sp. EFPC2]QSA97624.1 TRZ/ATZ family hydrolase [Methylococcus sp. EFPC2]